MGVGRKLFNHMLGVFRNAGMNEYFLFTDTTCDYGFYDYRGLTRKAERTVRRDSFTQGGLEDGALSFFLYEGVAERFCLVWKVIFSEKRQYMDSIHLFGLSIYRQLWTAQQVKRVCPVLSRADF